MGKFRKKFNRFLVYAILIITAFVSIFPCYWMFASAFNSTEQIVGGRLLPSTHLIENIVNLFSTYQIVDGLTNSLKISVTTVAGSLLVTSLAAYGFEKFRTPLSEKFYTLFLLGMMVPFTALIVPLYKMMAAMGLSNTAWAVILPAIGSIFLLFFFKRGPDLLTVLIHRL